jgi:chromosome segregation ATPase
MEAHMAKRTEESPKEATSYRSPWRVLARAFEKSRDLWKAKYKTLQERIKAFRTEVRDLRRSRDRWRARAEALEQESNELRAQLQRQAESPPALRTRSQPVLTQLSS